MTEAPLRPHIVDPATGLPIRRRRSAAGAANPAPASVGAGTASPKPAVVGAKHSPERPRPSTSGSANASPLQSLPSHRSSPKNAPAAPYGRRRRSAAAEANASHSAATSQTVGDVRRRTRTPARRRKPRFGTAAQIFCALLFWGLLAAIVYAADPGDEPAINAPARAGFVLALFAALFFTLLPIVRSVTVHFSHSRLFQERTGIIAVRQSLMVAAFLCLNALLQMVHVWTGLTALLIFGMLAVIEVVALARR